MANLFTFSIFAFLFCFSDVFSSDELEINADQFTYDKNNTRIYATGNVEVIDDLFKLSAEKVFLNNETNVISATDKVKIFDKKDGTILRANKIVADKTLDNAIIHENYLYIPTQAEIGDYALYLGKAGIEIEIEKKEYLIVPQSAILILIRDDIDKIVS